MHVLTLVAGKGTSYSSLNFGMCVKLSTITKFSLKNDMLLEEKAKVMEVAQCTY